MPRPATSRVARLLAVPVAALLVGTACGSGEPAEQASVKVAFVLVGARDDLGYNQAVWEASEAVARANPDADVVRVEDVPETDEARDVMEDLVATGATLIFATSFGHLTAARAIAEAHPDVVVVHQGGREGEPDLPNLGTYFGSHHEFLYGAGMVAARSVGSESPRLGYIVAFPIPATFANVNAFALGARSQRPDATVRVEFTGAWCDAAEQERAYDALVAAGVEAFAMHQDCTGTLLRRAEADGVGVVGYHSDGSEVAPTSWLIGAVWRWDRLFVDITDAVLSGRFATSPYSGDFRGTLVGGDNPASLTEAGPQVDAETIAAVDAVLQDFARGARTPFDGPVVDDAGQVRVFTFGNLSVKEVDAMDYFVEGVLS